MVPQEASATTPQHQLHGAPPFNGAMAKQICIPKSQILALPETMDVLEAAMLEVLAQTLPSLNLTGATVLEQLNLR